MIPTGKHHSLPGSGHQDYIFNSFNCFTGARAIRPAEGTQTVAFTLTLPEGPVLITSEDHVYERFRKGVEDLFNEPAPDFRLRFLFMESPASGYTFPGNVPEAYRKTIDDMFERVISTHPIPRSRASYDIDPGQYHISSWDWLHIWPSLVVNLVAEGSGAYDRWVFLVPGTNRTTSPPTPGLLEEEEGNAEGLFIFTLRSTVFVQADASAYTLAHEAMHSWGFNHSGDRSGFGYDPRELDARHLRLKYPKVFANVMIPDQQLAWDSNYEYDILLLRFVEQALFTFPGSRGAGSWPGAGCLPVSSRPTVSTNSFRPCRRR